MLYIKSKNEIYDGELILDDLIQKIVGQSTLIRFSTNDLNYLYQESVVYSKVFYSRFIPGMTRMGSVYWEIQNAIGFELKQYNKVILLFMHSHRHPLMMKEFESVSDIVRCFPENVVIKWGLGFDDSIGARLALYMICSK